MDYNTMPCSSDSTRSEIFIRLWALALLALGYIALYLQSPFLLIIVLVFLFHSGHESIHNNIFRTSLANCIYGVLSMSFMLHNYLIVRAAHLSHHACGRKNRPHCLVDHRQESASVGNTAYYYAYLLGSGYLLTMLSGFLFLVDRRTFRRHYPFVRYGASKIIMTQGIVLLHLVILTVSFGYMFILIYAIFMLYWSLSQNVAHYALPVGGDCAKYAARTYEVGVISNFLLFGSSFNHLSHHVLPSVPGFELRRADVQQRVRQRIGAEPVVVSGVGQYISDLFRQFKSPIPKIEPWKYYASGHGR